MTAKHKTHTEPTQDVNTPKIHVHTAKDIFWENEDYEVIPRNEFTPKE